MENTSSSQLPIWQADCLMKFDRKYPTVKGENRLYPPKRLRRCPLSRKQIHIHRILNCLGCLPSRTVPVGDLLIENLQKIITLKTN